MKLLDVVWFDGEMEESLKRNNVIYEKLGVAKPYALSTGILFGIKGGTEYELFRYTRRNGEKVIAAVTYYSSLEGDYSEEILLFKDEGTVNIEEIEKEIIKYNDSKKEI